MSCIPYEKSVTIDSNYLKQVSEVIAQNIDDDDFYFLTLYLGFSYYTINHYFQESKLLKKEDVLFTIIDQYIIDERYKKNLDLKKF